MSFQEEKTRDQLDAELIASIGESVRRGIAIMEDKYETLEVIASDSEDEGEIPIPRFDDNRKSHILYEFSIHSSVILLIMKKENNRRSLDSEVNFFAV